MERYKVGRYRKDKKEWRQIIAQTYIDSEVIDLSLDENGAKIIHETTAEVILTEEGKTEYEKRYLFAEYVGKIKRNHNKAVQYAAEVLKVPVFVAAPNKKIICITTNPNYFDAKTKDKDREVKRLTDRASAFMENIKKRHPEEFPRIKPNIKRLLTTITPKEEEE
jgi:hypothetical protein